MIKSFYTIGKVLSQDENYAEYFEPWANPFPKVKGDEAIVIFAQLESGKLLDNLSQEEFKKKLVKSYLYREAKARATNLVPTFYLQINNDSQKYSNNVRKMIDKVKASIKNYKHTFINDNQVNEVEQMLIKYLPSLDAKKQYLFTIKIDNKYFGDFDEFRNLFKSKEDAYEKYYKSSNSTDKLCAITNLISKRVWGNIGTLGFTVNDISFTRNGFDSKNSYKMFPVSPEVVKILEGFERITSEKLTKTFYGLKYFILPHFIFTKDESIIKEVFDLFFSKATMERNLESEGNGIISNDDIINEIIREEKLSSSDIYYDIFFYEQNQEQVAIKLHLSDVLPSRLKDVFQKKKIVQSYFNVLTRVPKNSEKKEYYQYFINFTNLREFFYLKRGKSLSDWIPLPIFYKTLEAVFCGEYLNEEEIVSIFIEDIRNRYKKRNENEFDFQNAFKKAFTVYHFFLISNLFKNMDVENESNILSMKEKIPDNMEDYLEYHKTFYDTNYKRGVFLLGCLVQRLLRVQMANLNGNKPFEKELNSLIINADFVEIIFRKTIDKLRERKITYSDIETLIIHYLSCAEEERNISKDKISFIFTSGLVMESFFKEQSKKLVKTI